MRCTAISTTRTNASGGAAIRVGTCSTWRAVIAPEIERTLDVDGPGREPVHGLVVENIGPELHRDAGGDCDRREVEDVASVCVERLPLRVCELRRVEDHQAAAVGSHRALVRHESECAPLGPVHRCEHWDGHG